MRFLITAGGTREAIDPVRFISNASSGKTGYALARAAIRAGHKVTLITGPCSIRHPKGVRIVAVESAGDMFEAVKKFFDKCDCLIMAAAVADYTPARPVKTKIKKSNQALTIKLKPTVDILKWAAKNRRKMQRIVGFALEDKQLRIRAEKKLQDKKLDMIVANEISVIGGDKSTVHIKMRDGDWLQITDAGKASIAKKIISIMGRG